MAKYKVVQNQWHTVLRTFWEEFDTEDQDKWESLRGLCEVDADEFSEEAPSDPKVWFELYKLVEAPELSEREDDEWWSDQEGTTEIQFELFDEADQRILSERA